ncbi:hypothetical protein GS910_01620 [Paraburkholderia sp. RL16-012-BIC-B]|nr:hypothetical protein [Paraburkholderia madseniana]
MALRDTYTRKPSTRPNLRTATAHHSALKYRSPREFRRRTDSSTQV